jgi:hypothetical protein
MPILVVGLTNPTVTNHTPGRVSITARAIPNSGHSNRRN